jgi:cobalt/nickel transport protein
VEDERLSGGLAGVVGALATLLIAGGIAWAVRRRGSPADPTADSAGPADPTADPAAEADDEVASSGQRR